MPLKQTVLPLLDDVTDLAGATGAANTVVLGDRRVGDNTDVHGLVAALREGGVRRVASGLVLGGGATAASALAALAALGDRSPRVLVREPARCGPLLAAAERLGSTPRVDRWDAADATTLREADVVVSTAPAGAADPLAAALSAGPAPRGMLLDVVYDPWPTVLARAWRGPVVSGAAMLLHQAARQVELMTGQEAPLAAMRAALDPALLADPGAAATGAAGTTAAGSSRPVEPSMPDPVSRRGGT